MVTYLGSLVQRCCREGGTLQTSTTGVCGERSQCLGPLGLPPLTACGLALSTLLRLQVALQGTCPKQAMGCMLFPGLSCSGSGSRVLHRDRLGWACVLCPSQVRAARATKSLGSTLPQVCGASYHLPHPSPSVSRVRSRSAISGASCVSSGELISGCNPPGGCQLSRIPGRLG